MCIYNSSAWTKSMFWFYLSWLLLCETAAFRCNPNRYLCYQIANGVCKHLLFQHLITDSPNRSQVNAMSVCVHMCKWVGGDMEWVTDNSQRGEKKWKGVNLVWLRWGNYSFPPLHCTPIMIINKLKVLEEHWELVANNTGPRKRGKQGRKDGWQDRRREKGGWEIIMLIRLALITQCPW